MVNQPLVYGKFITVMDNSEDSLWRFEEALGPDMKCINLVLGDVRDRRTVENFILEHSTVIHTAAYKHLRYADENAMETVMTNVIGTKNIIDALLLRNYPTDFVFVSTDKACYPTNVYGESKKLGEMLTRYAAKKCGGKLFSVRMGNFIGSRGSVLDKWHEQTKKGSEAHPGGEIDLTDGNMNRFFIKPMEVANFILDMLDKGAGKGQVYIPKMKAINMQRMANAYAYIRDCGIKVVGGLASERMDEMVANPEEMTRIQMEDDYFVIKNETVNNYTDISLSTAILPLLSLEDTKEYIKDVI